MARVLAFSQNIPYFVSQVPSLGLSRLPLGAEIVMVSSTQSLAKENLVARPDTPRIFITDRATLAPDGRRLVDVFGGRTLNLEQFQTRVMQ
jgi:hypothetical protein